MEPETGTSGFASMDRQKQREIAAKGGKAAHRKGTAHEFTVEEARDAGRKGGQSVSTNRGHMIQIGRLGGLRSAERRRIRALHRKQEATTEMSGQNMPEEDIVTQRQAGTSSPSEEDIPQANGNMGQAGQ